MTNKSKAWPLAGRIAYRFLFAYLILFFFPFPRGLVNPYWLGGMFEPLWTKFVPWFSRTFLHLQVTPISNGSGDTTYDYLKSYVCC